MLTTLLFGVATFTVLFFGLFLFRYALEELRSEIEARTRAAA
jgi:hypothetical protein